MFDVVPGAAIGEVSTHECIMIFLIFYIKACSVGGALSRLHVERESEMSLCHRSKILLQLSLVVVGELNKDKKHYSTSSLYFWTYNMEIA